MDPMVGGTMLHSALLYTSVEDATRRVLPLVDETLDQHGAVLVCLDDAKTTCLSAQLGARAERVTFLPLDARYARPALAVDGLMRFLGTQRDAGIELVHSIGEITLDGGETDGDWLRYEAAVPDVFAGQPLQATCLYPRSLGEGTLAWIARTHTHLDHDDIGMHASPAYDDPAAVCDHLHRTPLAPSRAPDARADGFTSARDARSYTAATLSDFGRVEPTGNLALVVSELVTNAVLHGGGVAHLSIWIEPSSVVVAVQDDGDGIDDPFAGLRPPSLPERGAGLWVAHHLSDRVTIDRAPTGATITVRFDLLAR